MASENKESSAYGKTKRRKHSIMGRRGPSYGSYLNSRISKLYKKMKRSHPSHIEVVSAATAFPTISTTGTLYDLTASIQQGDAPENRFSSQCITKGVNLKFNLYPGGSSNTPSNCRITIFRAQVGSGFAPNMTSSYNPVSYAAITRVYYDQMFQVAATSATVGFPTSFNKFVPVRHKQKYDGTGAAANIGETVYMVIQSDKTAGSTAPLIQGVIELFFDPT